MIFVISVLGLAEATRVSLYVGLAWIVLMSLLWRFIVRPRMTAGAAVGSDQE